MSAKRRKLIQEMSSRHRRRLIDCVDLNDAALPEETAYVCADEEEVFLNAEETEEPDNPSLADQESADETSDSDVSVNSSGSEDADNASDSASEDSMCDGLAEIYLALSEWGAKGVSRDKFSDLLKILRQHPCFSSLPADARTLLNAPRNVVMKPIGGGSYYHCGLKENLSSILQHYPLVAQSTNLNLLCSIDGLPLASSSGSQVWPILMSLVGHSEISPFVVGIFHGYEKPQSCAEYLEKYVEEVKSLINSGITFNGSTYHINVLCYVCDAPARAFISQIKSHTGYSGCGKCTIEGEYFSNRVVFNEIHCPPRTDESFSRREDESHHIGHSPLEEILGMGMVTRLPYEYMHLVCLGVMRKMLIAFTKGNLKVCLPGHKIAALSAALESIRTFIPVDSRAPCEQVPRYVRMKGVGAMPFGLVEPCFKLFQNKEMRITTKSPNNCVILDCGSVVIVHYMATKDGEPHLLGRCFEAVEEFYNEPASSACNGVYKVKTLGEWIVRPVASIRCKALIIPLVNDMGYYVAELLHHQY